MYPSVVGEVASLRDRVKRIIHRPYLPPPVRPSRSVQTQTRTAFIPLIRGNEKPKIRKKKKKGKRSPSSYLLLPRRRRRSREGRKREQVGGGDERVQLCKVRHGGRWGRRQDLHAYFLHQQYFPHGKC
ncbi:hypothetical protein B296_00013740 [Ensete ventricosum]|uniref:Uncharacterized protein n=1 Tax=Ensete ventricosum TaxID=4639 RepID=A0A426YYM5_ENSVE|nr:hypothetical protein B296_00013740 [Ensete ventricosum]